MDVQRILLKFDKTDGRLLEEHELNGIDISELRVLFGESESDPMYHSYDVTEVQKAVLENALGIPLDLSSYVYCIDVNRKR